MNDPSTTEVVHAMILERQRLLIHEANYLRALIGMSAVLGFEEEDAEISRLKPIHRAAHARIADAFRRGRYPESSARRRGAVIVEKFTKEEIYRRDAGRCHICGRDVSPLSWHLDHLVPISRGGVHSRDNVAVAHSLCNLRKGHLVTDIRAPGRVR